MVNISKIGDSAIKFTFTDNDRYLYNGEITVPLNSLILEIDSSELIIFKKVDGDVFVTFLIENSNFSTKEALIEWFEENMVAPQGGGGGGVTSGQVQTMIDDSVSGFADSVLYNSTSKYVEFYHGGSGGTKVYEFDASDFVIDGMVDDVRIETISGVSYLVIDFNTASGKEDIQIPLTDIFDPSNYYTKTEVDGIVSGKADSSAVTQEISAAVSGKQDTLSAGTNITIVDNVISAEGGGGKAVSGGTNISITTGETADTINCTLPISADSKGIYTTSTYPFLSNSNKSGNVVFGYNNRLDTFGSTKSSNYNLFFGSNNHITVNGSGMLIGGLNNQNQADGNYSNMSACVALGNSNIVKNPYEFASGQFNQTNYDSTSFGVSGNTLFSVGNGDWLSSSRHSAFEIRQNGDIYIADTNDTSTTKYYQKPMIKLQDKFSSLDTTIGNINSVLNNI